MPEISIVIRCCNEEQHIGRLLSGIMQQSTQGLESIVVDSGSTDATLSIAARFPVTIVSIRPGEFSFGRALNVGCRAARGRYIVFASAHTYPVYKDWLERLLAPFSDTKIALSYGKQRGNQVTKYSEHRVFAKWFPDEPVPNQNHPFCNNANAAIRRSVWEKIPYDENLTGLEDLDWAKRAIQLGYRVAYAPDAEMIHAHDESPRRLLNRYRREAIALKRIFPEQRFTFWDFMRLFTGNVVSDCYHASRDRILWRNIGGILEFRLMQFLGTYRGFTEPLPADSHLMKTFYYPNGFVRSQSADKALESTRCIEYSSGTVDGAIDAHH